MITLCIDLSSQPDDTAACMIDWHNDGHAIARVATLHCDDAILDTLVRGAEAIGIDAPFGWPEAFVEAVGQWNATTWDDHSFQKNLRLRLTDQFVHATNRLTPLSFSTDRIALPAMRAMALLARHKVADRSGDGRFFEVYPAGSLKRWNLDHQSYKKQENLLKRRGLLAQLRAALPSLSVGEAYADTDHAFDALIASLTTRAAATGKTLGVPTDQRGVASREGWIHLPVA